MGWFADLLKRRRGAPPDPIADQRARARWEGEGGATAEGPSQAERDGRPDDAADEPERRQ